MINLMSKAQNPLFSPHIMLKKMWKVDGDKKYDAYRTLTFDDDYIVVRTLSGTGRIKLIGKKEFILKAQSVFFFKYSDVEMYSTKGDTWEFFWFEFQAQLINLPLNNIFYVPIASDEVQQLNTVFNMLSSSGRALQASAGFVNLMLNWLYADENRDVLPEQTIVNTAINEMLHNANTDFSIEELAHRLGISDRYFRLLFKKQTGKSPKEFIIEKKLLTATEILSTSTMSIKSIALSLGFSDQYYFSKLFKLKQKVSPEKFRKTYRCPIPKDTLD